MVELLWSYVCCRTQRIKGNFDEERDLNLTTLFKPRPDGTNFDLAEVPLEKLVNYLQVLSDEVVYKYRTSLSLEVGDSGVMHQAEATIRKCQRSLQHASHSKVRQIWGNEEGESYLRKFNGRDSRFKFNGFNSFRSLVRQVLLVTRIVRHWRGQLTQAQRDFVEVDAFSSVNSTLVVDVALDIDSWDFDAFELEERSRRPLQHSFMAVWRQRDFARLCLAPAAKMFGYIGAIEQAYLENPYHNRVHATDVMLSACYLLSRLAKQDSMHNYFAEVDLFVVSIAAAVHDVGHPAVNNEFLVRTRHSMALRYNDRSSLENFHVATAFEMMRDMGVEALEHRLPSPPVAALRSRVIDMVLATDMAMHQQVIEDLAAEHGSHENLQDINKLALEKHLIHTADIGHPLRPHAAHVEWSGRIAQEFFSQGDQERELGVQPAALFDRERAPSLATGQIGFLNFVVMPAWTLLRDIAPWATEAPDRCLAENLARWQDIKAQEDGREERRA
mmetsp:Transcript_34426/g.67881  ORF Transcript_34426/g.67881 Transcript_34426/m.67881 type:complete len:501 (-) Transcript_34426:381-1883(-)